MAMTNSSSSTHDNTPSYLYLHPNENPAIALVSPVLNATNYHSWSRYFITALSAKDKVEFVLGSAPQPSKTDASFPAWFRCNSMVVSWLIHSVSPSIRESIIWMDLAIDIWTDLKHRFAQGDLARISALQMEATTLSQARLFPSGPRLYLSNKMLMHRLYYRAMQLLRGLNDHYTNIQSHILLLDPIPPISKIFSLVIQQERQLMNDHITASVTTTPFPSSTPTSVTCNYCNKVGHQENTCFKKHGFPNQEHKTVKTTNNNSRKICTYCHRNGHTIDICFKKHGYPPGHKFSTKPGQVHNVLSSTNVDNQLKSLDTERSSLETIQLTPQQYQILAELFKQSTTNNSNVHINQVDTVSTNLSPGNIVSISQMHSSNIWLLDSGATDHVCISLESFTSYQKINPIPICLPNGKIIHANYKGTVRFNTKLSLSNVLYVPDFSFNLVSVSQLIAQHKCQLIFSPSGCIMQDIYSQEKIGLIRHHNGLYLLDPFICKIRINCTPVVCSVKHTHLWHARLGHLSHDRLQLLQHKHGYINTDDNNNFCDACHRAKQKKLPYTASTSTSLSSFELLHIDIWGPTTASMNGYKYLLTIVDDYSRYTWIIPMIDKSSVKNQILTFLCYVENQFQKKVKTIRTDNGVEFILQNMFSSKGIIHQTTCVETPEQNGVVERKHQHILNTTRALLFHSHLPLAFWCYAAKHAVFLINQMPTHVLQNETPHERLHGSPCDLSMLRVFGCLCYANTITSHRKKFDDRAIPGIFLGFKKHTKGYLFLNLKNHKIEISRNVVFHENTFPYHNTSKTDNSLSLPIPHHYTNNYDELLPSGYADLLSSGFPHTNNPLPLDTCNNGTTHNTSTDVVQMNDTESDTSTSTRKSSRTRRIPAYLKDFQTNGVIRYPITNYINYNRLSHTFKHTILSISSNAEPTCYSIASKQPQCVTAMHAELDALQANNTWELTTLPPNKTTIGCRWIYKIKYNSDGSIERYKACLVAKGYNQIEGLDYLDTFAPVVKITTVRLLLAIAASKCWSLKQLDVNNAFLHGDLHEEVYMKIPPGLTPANKNQNLGDLTYFLGLEVARNSKGIHLSQRKYTLDLLAETGLLDSSPVPTPMVPKKSTINTVRSLDDTDDASYRRLIGKLIYLTTTRPDITFVVNHLSQFMSAPTTAHQQATGRILRYLKGTPGAGIFLPSTSPIQLKAFCDSDWAACPDTRRSVTGFTVYLGNSLISWRSKKQLTLSRSSSEAEYRSLASTVCEIQWLTYLLNDLHVAHTSPALIYCDNQSAIQIASTQVFHERTKHIDIDCHIVREKVVSGLIKLLPISTTMQLADILTKLLPPPTFQHLRSKLGLQNIYAQLEGG
ncbi:hypothetical protein V8G54_014718 [Vigna mungo]|uniref:Integrase catalytic domain-containing protein n=1 Tax=Vigna mungo TaxID=3915 RepID=A0AAQ3RYU1_VIGMU